MMELHLKASIQSESSAKNSKSGSQSVSGSAFQKEKKPPNDKKRKPLPVINEVNPKSKSKRSAVMKSLKCEVPGHPGAGRRSGSAGSSMSNASDYRESSTFSMSMMHYDESVEAGAPMHCAVNTEIADCSPRVSRNTHLNVPGARTTTPDSPGTDTRKLEDILHGICENLPYGRESVSVSVSNTVNVIDHRHTNSY